MITDLNKILVEWAYRTNDGQPDVKNSAKLLTLETVLKDFGWSREARAELLDTLITGKKIKSKVNSNVYEKDSNLLTKEQFIDMCVGIGDILTEASVHQDKYSVGHKVMWGVTGKKGFSSKLPKGEPMMTMPAEKTKPTENAIPIFQKDSGVEYYLKGANGKVYHLKGSASTLSGWFKHYKDNQTFSLDTTHLETASLLGVYLDAGSFLKKFNEADDESLPKIVTDFKNQVTSVLSGQDWSGNNLVSMMSKASIANIIQVCAIAAGMDKFCKQKGAKNWNIVHNKIDAYYKAEIKNPFTKTEGGKANTADCVVCDSSISSFLKNMESQKIYYDSNGLCRLETGEKFFQISLKKAEGEAQLGKITSDFSAKFGMISNNDLVNMLVHEGTELNEGIRDLFNKGKQFIQSVGKKVIDKIHQISNVFKSFYKKNLSLLKSSQKKSEKVVDDFVMNIKVDKKYLKEAKKPTLEDQIEAISKDNKAFNELYKFADRKFSVVIGNMKKPGLLSVGDKKIPKSKPQLDVVRKLMANAKAYDSINRILSTASGQVRNVQDVFKEMIALEKEMFFGRTSLPLVKVFGLKANGSGTAWKFLKTGKEFIEDRVSAFTDLPENVLIVNSTGQNGYMNISAAMLSHLDNSTQEPSYNLVSMRTNSASSSTFVIEGSKVVSLSYIKKNYIG